MCRLQFTFFSLCRIRVSFRRVSLFSQFSWYVSPPSLFSWHMSSVSSPSCCSWRGSPSKFSFITSMAFFDHQNKTIKEFIYASLLLGVCRLQSILVLWHLSHLRWFLLPYIEPQVSCQQSESPLGLIFMVCISLQVSMTCVALPFMVHFSRCVVYFLTSIYILWLLSLLISRGRP